MWFESKYQCIIHLTPYLICGRIFRNAPTIDFPDNTAGIRGLFAPAYASWVEFEAQILDGDNDWEDIGDHIFTTYQTNIKPGFFNRDGNYRIYGWYKDTKYTDWADSSKTNENKTGEFWYSKEKKETTLKAEEIAKNKGYTYIVCPICNR